MFEIRKNNSNKMHARKKQILLERAITENNEKIPYLTHEKRAHNKKCIFGVAEKGSMLEIIQRSGATGLSAIWSSTIVSW